MNVNPAVLGQVVARPVEQPVVGDTPARQEPAASLRNGTVLQARVISVDSRGSLILETGGGRYLVNGSMGLIEGQSITVRIAAVQPQLLLDIIAERTPAEQSLATALKNLFSGNTLGARQWQGLADALRGLESLPRHIQGQAGIPPQQLLEAIQQRSAPVQADAPQAAADLQAFIRNLGMDVESTLRNMASGNGNPADLHMGLKQMLGRIIAAIQGNASSTASQTAVTQGTIQPQTVQILQNIVQQFVTQQTPHLTRPVAERLQAIAGSIIRQLTAAAEPGPERFEQLRAALTGGRTEMQNLASQLSGESRLQFTERAERLFADLQDRLFQDNQGRQILLRLMLTESERSASSLRDRVEALQTLNAHLGERGGHSHLLFPAEILNELTEVQIKHFKSGKKQSSGARETHTIVMLLELESLGSVRIDALRKQNALYVSLSVERDDIKNLVEEMAVDFASQLEARGFRLGKLVCRVDGQHIQQFHRLDADVLTAEEALIDLKI